MIILLNKEKVIEYLELRHNIQNLEQLADKLVYDVKTVEQYFWESREKYNNGFIKRFCGIFKLAEEEFKELFEVVRDVRLEIIPENYCISHSQIGAFFSCPRLYYYLYHPLGRYRAKKEEGQALSIGRLVHMLLEVENTTHEIEEIKGNMKASALAHSESLVKIIKSNFDVAGVTQRETIYRDANYKLVGTIDGIVNNDTIIDYKTTGSPLENIEDNQQYISQLKKYCFLTGNQKAKLIVVKKLGLRRQKTETEEAFAIRLRKEYQEKKEQLFTIFDYNFTYDELLSEAKGHKEFFDKYVSTLLASKNIPACNKSSCNSPSWNCSFYNVCNNKLVDADAVLEINFEKTTDEYNQNAEIKY